MLDRMLIRPATAADWDGIWMFFEEIVRALARPETKEKFLTAGTNAIGSSPEVLAATIKSEMTKWGKLIKSLGIKADQG